MSGAPNLQQLFDFIRARSYPVTFFELSSAYPYNVRKLRTRCTLLVKQGYLEHVEGDAFIVSAAYLG